MCLLSQFSPHYYWIILLYNLQLYNCWSHWAYFIYSPFIIVGRGGWWLRERLMNNLRTNSPWICITTKVAQLCRAIGRSRDFNKLQPNSVHPPLSAHPRTASGGLCECNLINRETCQAFSDRLSSITGIDDIIWTLSRVAWSSRVA